MPRCGCSSACARRVDAEILGPAIVREIVYRALCGPQGHLLLEMVGRQGQAAQINAALRWIHSRYAEPFSVTRMAEEVGMSVSAFHHQFKALTASSPVQYLKSVRLHKARALIVDEGSGAAVAAAAVGYESASQFSREFKRFFGASPTEEARRVRAFVAEPAQSRFTRARLSCSAELQHRARSRQVSVWFSRVARSSMEPCPTLSSPAQPLFHPVPRCARRARGAPSATSPLAPLSIERREPLADDVVIEILYCGVCHSDLHQVRNEWQNTIYPIVPGHEIVGRVTRVGAT